MIDERVMWGVIGRGENAEPEPQRYGSRQEAEDLAYELWKEAREENSSLPIDWTEGLDLFMEWTDEEGLHRSLRVPWGPYPMGQEEGMSRSIAEWAGRRRDRDGWDSGWTFTPVSYSLIEVISWDGKRRYVGGEDLHRMIEESHGVEARFQEALESLRYAPEFYPMWRSRDGSEEAVKALQRIEKGKDEKAVWSILVRVTDERYEPILQSYLDRVIEGGGKRHESRR